ARVITVGDDALVADVLELGRDRSHVGPGQVATGDCGFERSLDRVLPGPTRQVGATGTTVLRRVEPLGLGGGADRFVARAVRVPTGERRGALVDGLEERHGLAALEGHVPGRAGAQDLELLVATLEDTGRDLGHLHRAG